jgi:hypothetical protein
MKTHLVKHGIYCPTFTIPPGKKGPDIRITTHKSPNVGSFLPWRYSEGRAINAMLYQVGFHVGLLWVVNRVLLIKRSWK